MRFFLSLLCLPSLLTSSAPSSALPSPSSSLHRQSSLRYLSSDSDSTGPPAPPDAPPSWPSYSASWHLDLGEAGFHQRTTLTVERCSAEGVGDDKPRGAGPDLFLALLPLSPRLFVDPANPGLSLPTTISPSHPSPPSPASSPPPTLAFAPLSDVELHGPSSPLDVFFGSPPSTSPVPRPPVDVEAPSFDLDVVQSSPAMLGVSFRWPERREGEGGEGGRRTDGTTCERAGVQMLVHFRYGPPVDEGTSADGRTPLPKPWLYGTSSSSTSSSSSSSFSSSPPSAPFLLFSALLGPDHASASTLTSARIPRGEEADLLPFSLVLAAASAWSVRRMAGAVGRFGEERGEGGGAGEMKR